MADVLDNGDAIMMKLRKAILSAMLLFSPLFVLETESKVLHVDAHKGNDTFIGSESKPMKTIGKASTIAEPGDTILIHEGVYHEQISKGRSGEPGAPITYVGTDRSKVVMQGSVRVKDWKKKEKVWVKEGLSPITHVNAFVMVDEKRLLKKVDSPDNLSEGCFHLSSDGIYTIRMHQDADPNTDHNVDVYELDFAFNSGNRWGGTAKKHIVLKNMTIEKYGVTSVSTDTKHPQDNSHWELDRLLVRFNHTEGVFHCLDDWYVHDCDFIRNRAHGCQIDGARVRFTRNRCSENLWFGAFPDGGCGLLIGPDASAHSCVITDNVFENNGGSEAYGCGVYLEGRSYGNLIENNRIIGGSHAGVGFFGSSHNKVINNLIVHVAPKQQWRMAAAFVVGHSYEGAPTQSVGNLIAYNTIWGCPAPLAVDKPTESVKPNELNRFVNNFFGGCNFLSDKIIPSVVEIQGNVCYACPRQRGLDRILRAGSPVRICDAPMGKTIVQDPGFQNPDAGDFRLKSDSPLRGAGIILPDVPKDCSGAPRPSDRNPAVGAYEFSVVH